MPVQNLAIAAIFDEIGDRLAIQGANVFRIRAYKNAPRTLQELGEDVGQMVARGDDLTELPGNTRSPRNLLPLLARSGTARRVASKAVAAAL